jgi:hypothetical protein
LNKFLSSNATPSKRHIEEGPNYDHFRNNSTPNKDVAPYIGSANVKHLLQDRAGRATGDK